MKRKFQEEQEDSDAGWLSTRNKRKISPTVPHPRKRKSFSRPVRCSDNYSNLRLTQNSPPPPQLKTATKQTSIINFFGNSTPSALESPASSVLQKDDLEYTDAGANINDLDHDEGCHSNKKDNASPRHLNDDQVDTSPGYESSGNDIENSGIENCLDNNSDIENLVVQSGSGNHINTCNDDLLEDGRREKCNEHDSNIENFQINQFTRSNIRTCVAADSQGEISPSSSSASLSSSSSSDRQDLCVAEDSYKIRLSSSSSSDVQNLCLAENSQHKITSSSSLFSLQGSLVNENSQHEISPPSSPSPTPPVSSSDRLYSQQNLYPHLQTKVPLRDRTNLLDSVQADFELNSMLPVTGCDSEMFISQSTCITDHKYGTDRKYSVTDRKYSVTDPKYSTTDRKYSATDCKYRSCYKDTKRSDFDYDEFKPSTKSHCSKEVNDSHVSQNFHYLKDRSRKTLIDSEDADLELQDFSLEC